VKVKREANLRYLKIREASQGAGRGRTMTISQNRGNRFKV